jgi:hypothetical protein
MKSKRPTDVDWIVTWFGSPYNEKRVKLSELSEIQLKWLRILAERNDVYPNALGSAIATEEELTALNDLVSFGFAERHEYRYPLFNVTEAGRAAICLRQDKVKKL